MSHSHTPRNAHVPPWKLFKAPRIRGLKSDCNHRRGWEIIDLNGRHQDICRRCGAVRQVQA